jgi:hypothetical protein
MLVNLGLATVEVMGVHGVWNVCLWIQGWYGIDGGTAACLFPLVLFFKEPGL